MVNPRLAASSLIALSACTSTATARFEFANHTVTTAARSPDVLADGTSLRVKIISVYLAEDVDAMTMDNIGESSTIWLNPECNGDNDGCNVDGFAQPAGPRITKYFDLSRPTDEVNADLNSQALPIDPATYRYARIDMCKAVGGQNEATVPTVMWKGPGMTAEQPFTSGDCGRTSLAFDPPLVLAAGDAVTVSLGYDLAQSIVAGAPHANGAYGIAGYDNPDGSPRIFRTCFNISADQRVCMDYPDLTPAATKQ